MAPAHCFSDLTVLNLNYTTTQIKNMNGICAQLLSQSLCVCVCVRLHGIQPVLRVDYVSKNLAAAQHGTITMEGDNLIVLNGGFRVNAPPAGSCQVVISHYGR